MDFKEEWNWLNSYQMEAVTDENDACIVNANVGSGKTTVLIAKILYLHYEKKIPLEKMVVLTFTNKAAGEIIERLKKKEPELTEEQVQFFGTFHSVAMRMLKNTLLQAKAENGEIAHTVENSSMVPEEWTSEFEIIDPDEEQELALCLIAEYSLKVKYKNRLKKRLEQEYPNYKAEKVTSRYKDELFRLYPLLQKEKKKENKMSFSDLLEEGTRLLKMGKNSRPEWIIVDEVQDSDRSQLEFLEALKGPETKIFAVGDPNQVIYVVDKRQELHFVQVFRCAKKTGIVKPETELTFLGFGTMNGKDGKPFKTREGGVMRLENLIREIDDEMYKKIMDNRTVEEEDARRTAEEVGLAAIKYGDLSNQASKDYIFDVDRFTSFEGNTGPYILYTIVRIKSILKKYAENGGVLDGTIRPAENDAEKSLMLQVVKFNEVIDNVYKETAPHKLCAYIYDLANDFNKFYHETKILSEEDFKVQASYIGLLVLTKNILETCIDVLGFSAPDRM